MHPEMRTYKNGVRLYCVGFLALWLWSLASSTLVYGHDYAQEGQREDTPSSPKSSNVPDSEESSEDPLQEQPFDGDPPLFPETPVRRKKQPQEMEKRSLSGSKSAAGNTGNERVEKGNEHVERERVPPKRYHYRNPPIWTTPTGLVLIGWRMRCPVCYHQDGHSATCSERWELPVILWIQPMFIHGIVHYMTYADGEWWHDRDPKPRQLWGRGHRVHRLSEGTDCLLEWGASFPKSEHSAPDQRESQKFGGDVPFLDLTIDSTQGRDGFIDDPYVPGDQGYHSLPRRERVREVRTQSPARDTPQQTGSAEHQEHTDVPAHDGVVSGKVTLTAQRIAAGAGGGPDPPPDNKLCDHCLQATP